MYQSFILFYFNVPPIQMLDHLSGQNLQVLMHYDFKLKEIMLGYQPKGNLDQVLPSNILCLNMITPSWVETNLFQDTL